MKLTDLYIENFGKLSAYRYTFTDGLNVINEENGYGKSTLAAFIKAMLYGMEDTRKTKLDENDRKKFMPWSGGLCGGTLTFTVGGKKYKIERTFAAKASDDTFTLYDCESGLVSHDYTENLGEELFGINADGFERTVFLSERRLSVKNENKTISAKLSDLVGYDCDLGELDEAMNALDERRKYYYKRGGTGRISDVASRIADINIEINNLLRTKDMLPEKEKQLADAEREIVRLEDEVAQFEIRRQMVAHEKQYLEKKAQKDAADYRLCKAREFFANGIPTQAEIRIAERVDEDYRSHFTRVEESKGEPDGTVILTKEIAEAERLAIAVRGDGEKKKKSSPALPLLLLSIILCGGGGALAATVSLYAGIAMIAIGVILLIAAVAVGASSKKVTEPAFFEEIRAMLAKEKIQSEPEGYLAALLEIKVKKENELRIANEKLSTMKEYETGMKALKARRDEFLSKYPTVSDDPYTEIRKMLGEYEFSEQDVKRLARELDDIVRDHGVNAEKLNGADVVLPDMSDARRTENEEMLKSIRRSHVLLTSECSRYREDLSRLDELYARRDELQTELDECKDRLDVIKLTQEHLEKAKNRLTAKYLGKTRAAFAEYLNVIGNDDPELFTLDTSFAVMKSEGGQSKPQEAYSLGTREFFSLASRLALVDSLYDTEEPFILLDDPFVYFDDKRTQSAVKALRRIADKKQIIYFTCSKSRAI